MYKVVIVDDEPVIVRGLTQLIPWEKYGCVVAGTAQDGREGLELIRSLRPQIVFSDIYMPKMDGLTMAAGMKSEFEDMELTILTGYRDFDLAQQAIRLGVTRFLLKPSNMEELEEAVRVMVGHLRRKGIPDPDAPEADGQNESAETAQEMPEQNGANGAVGMTNGMPERNGANGAAGTADRASERNGANGAAGMADEAQAVAGRFLVNKALEYMRENYNHKVTLPEVAEHTYVSQWHLSKLLNRHTQQSFSELMNSIRIEEAKKLLADSSLRIGDIAEMVGFLDMAHFSRVFKKVTGISANEYRNRQ